MGIVGFEVGFLGINRIRPKTITFRTINKKFIFGRASGKEYKKKKQQSKKTFCFPFQGK